MSEAFKYQDLDNKLKPINFGLFPIILCFALVFKLITGSNLLHLINFGSLTLLPVILFICLYRKILEVKWTE